MSSAIGIPLIARFAAAVKNLDASAATKAERKAMPKIFRLAIGLVLRIADLAESIHVPENQCWSVGAWELRAGFGDVRAKEGID